MTTTDPTTKPCPACGGIIKAAAIKCKHCGQHVDRQQGPSNTAPSTETSTAGPSLAALAIIGLPMALAAMHGVIFGAAGVGWTLALIPVAILAGATVANTRSLRGRSAMAIGRALVRRRGLLAVAVIVVVAAEGMAVRSAIAHNGRYRELAAAIESQDPCAVEKHSSGAYYDFGLGDVFRKRSEECDTGRKLRLKQAHAGRCQALVKSVKEGTVTPKKASWLGGKVELLQRIQDGALFASDLSLDTSELPCGPEMVALYLTAAARSHDAWRRIESVSEVSQEVVRYLNSRPQQPALSTEAAKALRHTADAIADAYRQMASTADRMKDALELCTLAEALTDSHSRACKRAESTAARLAAHDSRRQKREARAREREYRRGAARCARSCRGYARCLGRCGVAVDDQGGTTADMLRECGRYCAVEMTSDCAECSERYNL
jgi:hypothetical protein